MRWPETLIPKMFSPYLPPMIISVIYVTLSPCLTLASMITKLCITLLHHLKV